MFYAQIVFLVFISSGCVLARKGAGSWVCRSKGFQLWTVLDVLLFFPFFLPLRQNKDLSCSTVSKPCRQNPRKVWLLNTFCIISPPKCLKMILLLATFLTLLLFQILILLCLRCFVLLFFCSFLKIFFWKNDTHRFYFVVYKLLLLYTRINCQCAHMSHHRALDSLLAAPSLGVEGTNGYTHN